MARTFLLAAAVALGRSGAGVGSVGREHGIRPPKATRRADLGGRVFRARAVALADAAGEEFEQLDRTAKASYLARAGFEPFGLHEARHTFASLPAVYGRSRR